MPKSFESPRSSEGPRARAEHFFELVKRRKELWDALRSPLTVEEGVDFLKSGQAHNLFEVLKMRRATATQVAAESGSAGEHLAKKGRLAKRLAQDPQKRVELENMEKEIRELLSDPAVHSAIHGMGQEQVKAKQQIREVMNEYRDLQAVDGELSTHDFTILRRKSVSDGDRRELRRNGILRQEVENRLRRLTESPETALAARLAELFSYREQLLKDHYAMTPSRRELADQIRSLWARGEAVMLTGSTGTGKTELFSYLTKLLYGRPLSRLIRATHNVTPAEIFGKMGLRASADGSSQQRERLAVEVELQLEKWKSNNKNASADDVDRAHDRFLHLAAASLGVATETFFQPGVYIDAVDQGMPFVIDEFNLLEDNIRRGLKELYNRQPGESVVVQEDSGRPHVIQNGFVFGATANIKSDKFKGGRFELGPEESRVWSGRKVDFLPKEEVYDLLLALLMNSRGELRLSREDATETLKRLLEAAELSQQAFEGKQTQFYAEGGGAKKTLASLEKAVIDPGRVLKIVSGWPREEAQGKRFRDYLENEILHVIRTENYPEKDQRFLLQIFVTKGFFNGKTARELGIPGMDEAKLKAWGWNESNKPASKTEILTPASVADFDPFDIRKLRASDSADEFLLAESDDAKEALNALRGINPSSLSKNIQKLLKQKADRNILLAESPDGTELRFDLQEIREQWDSFYRSHNLGTIADLLPQTITLTQEQIETLKVKAKEGYTRAILIPAGIEQHLQELKEHLTDGLGKDKKGNPIETWLSSNVKPDFPNAIQTTDPLRLGKAYLLLTNPNEPLHPHSKNKSADTLIAEFQSAGLSGLTLADFLIEERKYFEETGNHLIDWGRNEWTWLLASRDSSSRVLYARWGPGDRQVAVVSHPSGDSVSVLGARSSVVLALESLP